MNPRLNKKVKKDLDAYFKGYKGSDPEVHHGVKHILIGALRDANFHSEAKKVDSMFPKAKQSKFYGKSSMEDSIEQNHGEPIAKAAKWDGYDIIDAIGFFVSMFIGGPVGAKVTSLKEGMNESLTGFIKNYIKEVTHSYEYEDMSGKEETPLGEDYNEDENDKEEIKIGEYQTKYFHVCPGASSLYGDIESKGVDMDMAERSVRLQDALFFIEEHVGRDGYSPDKDYVMVAKNIAKNIMKMGKMMGLEKEHSYIQGHVDTIIKSVEGKKLEERIIELTEKNVPTDSGKWAASKAAAKQKFDVYPSAYANAWAAKNYKAKGGGWKTENKESIDEAKSMDTKKKLKVYDKLKKGDEITIKYGSSMSSGREGKFKVTKGKTVVGKQKVERIILQNVANPKGVKYYLYQRNGNVTMAIGDMAASIEDMHESVNESLNHNDMYTMLDIAAGYSSTQHEAAGQMWSDEQDLYDYLKSDHIPKKYHKKFYNDIKRRFKGVNESVNESKFAGWIAGYNGKQIEIKKGEAKDLYNAKLLAIKKLKVPKSKLGLMFIKPAVDESVNEGVKIRVPGNILKKVKKNPKDVYQSSEYAADGSRISYFSDTIKNKYYVVYHGKNYEVAKHIDIKGNPNKFDGEGSFKAFVKKYDRTKKLESVVNESVNEAKEPEVITQLRKIVKDSQNDLIKDTKSGKKVRVDMNSANLIVQVYDALKKQSNKDKFVKSGIAMMGHTAYKLMKKEDVSESGIMYKAGVKKYGKEGMTKIQSAAGKGEGHEEIGKIKDKYDKSKNEAVKPLKASASFSEVIEEGEYQGRKVELNKPMQGDVKKFKVYVNNDKGNVVKVNFGAKGMNIKKNNPEARKSFRARMNCDNPGPKWKANYWSCKKW